MALPSIQPRTELTTRISFVEEGVEAAGASASWNVHGLPRPVQGLVYLSVYLHLSVNIHQNIV